MPQSDLLCNSQHPKRAHKRLDDYIFDNGVRNALIHDFSPMSLQADARVLWENFFFKKRIALHGTIRDFKSMYFWRTTRPYPKEIDLIPTNALVFPDYPRDLEIKQRSSL